MNSIFAPRSPFAPSTDADDQGGRRSVFAPPLPDGDAAPALLPTSGPDLPDGGTIEEAKSFQPSMLRHTFCPNCGREGLRTKKDSDRRFLADGLEQPHCDRCGRDVSVDVAAQAFLDHVKVRPITPDSLRCTEEVVAFIRDAHSTGTQHAN